MKKLLSSVFFISVLFLSACSDDEADSPAGDSSATELNRLYFSLETPDIGQELWSSDGTEAGTALVKDINQTGSSYPSNYVDVNGVTFFTATNANNNQALFKSDAGVVTELKEFIGGYIGFNSPVAFNNLLFFEARSDTGSYVLWVSDGTSEGTTTLTTSSVDGIIAVEGTGVFFTRSSSQLWITDGTEIGTVQITPDTTDSFGGFSKMVSYVGKLYFITRTNTLSGGLGYELWSSDGTNAGTNLFLDVYTGASSGLDRSYSYLTVANNLLVFTGNDGTTSSSVMNIWVSDGTEIGTVKLQDSSGTDVSVYKYRDYQLLGAGDKLYFNNYQSSSQLWESDGSSANTVVVSADVMNAYLAGSTTTGVFYERSSRPMFYNTVTNTVSQLSDDYFRTRNKESYVFANDNLFYIRRSDNGEPKALIHSDGTVEGTSLVTELDEFYSNTRMIEANGSVIFTGYNKTTGVEPWITDGTSDNTVLLADINITTNGDLSVRARVGFNNEMYFIADDGVNKFSLWKTDGTPGGTVLVKVINGESLTTEMVVSGNKMYFGMSTIEHGNELWVSDGSTSGTLIMELAPADNGVGISKMLDVNGTLFVSVNGELIKTDGTLAGTEFVAFIDVFDMESVDGLVYFMNYDGLWKTDGTFIGTEFIRGGFDAEEFEDEGGRLISLNGRVLFMAYDNVSGNEFWISDGTYDGTHMLAELFDDEWVNFDSDELVVLNNELFFARETEEFGTELWKTDGTESGTVLVKDINLDGDGLNSNPELIVNNGLLYFTATDGDLIGREVWVSDGTEAGTHVLKNIAEEDNTSSYPYGFTTANNTVFFQIYDEMLGGVQLWKTDGTESGTLLVKDFSSVTDNELEYFDSGYNYGYYGCYKCYH